MRKHFSLKHLRQIAHWIWLGKYYLLIFAVVIISILYILRVLHFYTNGVSAFLSIIGLTIILRQQILDAKKFADHRPNTLPRWIMSYPTGKPITVSLGTGIFIVIGHKARLTVSIPEDATIENKVDFLLRQVRSIEDTIAKSDDQIDDLAASLTSMSKELKTELDNLNKHLKTTIAGHVVGDYDVNLLGIIFTICGTLIHLFRS